MATPLSNKSKRKVVKREEKQGVGVGEVEKKNEIEKKVILLKERGI